MSSASATPTTRLYVGNLPNEMDKTVTEEMFSKHGKVSSVWIAKNPPGFGFIEFENEHDSADAVKNLDGKEFYGQKIRVEFAKPTSTRQPRGSGPRGGDRYDDRRDDRRDDDRRGPRRDDERGGPPNPYAAYAAYYAGYPPYGGMPYGNPYAMPPTGYDARGAFPGAMPGAYPGAAPGAYPAADRYAGAPPQERAGAERGGDRRPDREFRRAPAPEGREHVCFNCNLTGHWAKDCPKPKNSGECYNCNQRGHMSRDCPQVRAGGNGANGGGNSYGAGNGGNGGNGGNASYEASARGRSRSPERRRSRSRSRSRDRQPSSSDRQRSRSRSK